MKNFSEAITWLDKHINYERSVLSSNAPMRPGKMRMEILLDLIGRPEKSFKIVHISGTKGKGSTCVMVYSLIRTAGKKCGLFTSPHLMSVKERFCGPEGIISDEEFVSAATTLEKAVDSYDWLEVGIPSYFELTTALALLYFKNAGCEFVVLETGLGGTFDATNTVTPIISAITRIDYDHTDILGETLKEISSEKAGIIKPGIQAVTINQLPEAMETIKEAAAKQNSPLLITDGKCDYEISIPGEMQKENGSLALKIFDCIVEQGHISLSEIEKAETIEKGLSRILWAGRLEKLKDHPLLYIDGAHNKVSMNATLQALAEKYEKAKILMIFNTSKNKDIDGMVKIAAEYNAFFIGSGVNHPRVFKLEELKEKLPKENTLAVTATTKEALGKALEIAEEEKDIVLLATGSFFLAGEIRELLAEPIKDYLK